MGTDTTPENIRAFIVPHDISIENLWDAESSYTDTQTQPSAPQPGSSYELGLTASGEFTSAKSLRVQTQRAGHVGRASFVWRETDETDFYGYNAPNILERWESIVDGNAVVTQDNVLCDALGNTDGSSVVLYQKSDTTVTNTRKIKSTHRDKDGTLTAAVIYSQTDNAQTLFGGMCVLSDDSILAVYLETDNTSLKANLRSARSHDKGKTWTEQAKTLLEEDIDLSGSFGAGNSGFDSIQRIRIAESKGEILLIVSAVAHNTTPASTDVILQYVSTDNGCSFVFIGQSGGSFAYYRPDIVVKDETFFVGYILGAGEAELLRLESATQTIDIAKNFDVHDITTETVAGSATSGHFTKGEMSIFINSTGRIYACFMSISAEKRVFILQSDDGQNWFYLGGNPTSGFVDASQIYDIDDSSSRPTLFAGCSSRGVIQFFHNYDTRTHSRDNGIHVLELGGYTTVSNPSLNNYPRSFDFGGWDYTWVSYDTPDDTAHYTATGSGTTTATATHTRFESTNPNNIFVSTPTFSSTSGEGIIIRTRLKVVSQGSSTSGRGIKITTNDNDVEIFISTTSISVIDTLASSTIGTLSTTVTTDFEILVAIKSNTIKLWTCTDRNTPGEKRWKVVASGALNSTGGGSNNQIHFGHLDATSGAVAAVQTDWYEFHYSFGARTGNQITSQENPEELNTRQYPPRGETVYITGGTKISSFDGPAYNGEHYTIEKDSLYPLRRVFFSNSPTTRTKYRSSNDSSTHTFSFFWDATNQDNSNMSIGSDSFGLFLGGVNFNTYNVDVYDKSSTSWVNLATVNSKVGGTTFTRTGASVVCTNASGSYIQHNELAGYLLAMGSGIVRKIKSNTAGYLSNTTTAKRCIFQLEDFATTDPTSITGYITPDRHVTVFHRAGATTGCAFRISIPAQDTPNNYFEIGNITIGPVIPVQQYSNGRTISVVPGTTTTETPDGTRRTQKNFESYKTLRIAWVEGIDISQIYDGTTEADYYTLTTATGAEPVATPSDTPTTIMGIFQQLDGESRPVVYLPKLLRSVKQNTTLQTKDEFLFCTMQNDISIEHVLGDELDGNSGEVFRVSSLTLRQVK